MRRLNPTAIHPPFANYAHGVEAPPGARFVFCSGQLGIGRDAVVPEGVEAQARLCFRAIVAILAEAGMNMTDVVRLNAYVSAAEHLSGYMKVRDEFVGNPPPASTLMVVQGFARPEFKVEIEAVAAKAEIEMASKYWADWSWRDFADADMSGYIAVLPVAAVEQHGPHLPVGVDTYINQGYLARAVARTPDDLPVLYLPVQSIGKSNEHIEYPGTLTFTHETVIRAWTELGDSVARAGVRKLVFINSHGGNVPVIDIVARELRVRHHMLAVHAAWHRLGLPEGLFSAQERAHGIHGGEVETSLMLTFRPETVRMDRAEHFVSSAVGIEQEMKQLRVTQPVGFGWMASDLTSAGVAGDASQATTEKGEACAEHAAAAFIDLLRDVHGFDLARLQPGPLAK